MSKKPRLRFVFTIAEGPNAGLTSGPWRAWTKGEDCYIVPRAPDDVWKVSLHVDAAWRLAMTSEHVASGKPPQLPEGVVDRAMWKFQPTKFVHGRRLAFAIAATRSAMLPGALSETDLHIAVRDRWDEVTVAYFWMTEPDVELVGGDRRVGEPLLFQSGRRLWMSAGVEQVVGQPEPMAQGAMIAPMSPENDDVAAPGLMLKGLRLS